jgi:hypothetical protein
MSNKKHNMADIIMDTQTVENSLNDPLVLGSWCYNMYQVAISEIHVPGKYGGPH